MGIKKSLINMEGSQTPGIFTNPRLGKEVVIVGVLAVLFVLSISFMRPAEQAKDEEEEKPNAKYLIPADGGALQLMPKDEDGNASLKLIKKIKVSDDTFIYRFGFQDEKMAFGLPIGNHVVFSANIPNKAHPEGEFIQRKYTPISPLTDRGFCDFLIKVYGPNIHPRFPEGGMMSQHVDRLKIGDSLLMEGPKGRLKYEGLGNFVIAKKPVTGKTKIGLIAGGTGITPCYQIIQAILANNDTVTAALLFGNRTINDILLKDELAQMHENHKDKFKLFFTVDIKPDEKDGWTSGVGFVNTDMMKKYLPAPSPETLICYCGPPLFEKDMKSQLTELGYDMNTMVFKF